MNHDALTARNAQIAAAVTAGSSLGQVAKLHDLSRQRVMQICARNGVHSVCHPRADLAEKLVEMQRLWTLGWADVAIADELGWAAATVKDHRSNLSLPINTTRGHPSNALLARTGQFWCSDGGHVADEAERCAPASRRCKACNRRKSAEYNKKRRDGK